MLPSLKGLLMVNTRADRAFMPLALPDSWSDPNSSPASKPSRLGGVSPRRPPSRTRMLCDDGRPVSSKEAGISTMVRQERDLAGGAWMTACAPVSAAHPLRGRGQEMKWRHRGTAMPRAAAVPRLAPLKAGRAGAVAACGPWWLPRGTGGGYV
jgi:hypothetical protein